MPNEAPNKDLDTEVRYVKGVGQVRAEQLDRLDIHTVEDLLFTLPHRYEDRRRFSPIRTLRSGEEASVQGRIMACGWVKARYGKSYFEAMVGDGSGLLAARWFGATYLRDILKLDQQLILHGKVRMSKGQAVIMHPDYERVDDQESGESLHHGRIVPVYGLTEHLPQRVMRRMVWNALDAFGQLPGDPLPGELLTRLDLAGLTRALRDVHFPDRLEDADRARHRLVFEEFLCLQLVLAARKVQTERFTEGMAHEAPGRLLEQLLDSLPFQFTGAQDRVVKELRVDMARPRPMHRLLQGDVGSGKTVVAAAAAAVAVECGSQVAVMAPTEILARQHFRTFSSLLEPLGVRSALLVSDLKGADRKDVLSGLKSGRIQVVAGTHAIIQDRVEFARLGLAVIDEQHKFGVEQRGLLYGKNQHPDVLVMTATPIPRTLAMTLYGDLDVSVLDEGPLGRQEIVTRVIREEKLSDAYGFIAGQVAKGRQAYLVYPLVSESEESDLRSAEEMYATLGREAFQGLRLGLLHGQLPGAEKERVMQAFRSGELDLLVATTVVEVGVDVPNATVMLVEHAERFGLSQLHQLRGRIGRGAHKSFCILQGEPKSVDSWKRLKVMEETTDGFQIAEEDLRIRGMGNLLGREQSGFPGLRMGDPLGDAPILSLAREEAFRLVGEDPRLEQPEHALLRERARRLYRHLGGFAEIG